MTLPADSVDPAFPTQHSPFAPCCVTLYPHGTHTRQSTHQRLSLASSVDPPSWSAPGGNSGYLVPSRFTISARCAEANVGGLSSWGAPSVVAPVVRLGKGRLRSGNERGSVWPGANAIYIYSLQKIAVLCKASKNKNQGFTRHFIGRRQETCFSGKGRDARTEDSYYVFPNVAGFALQGVPSISYLSFTAH